jgi:putative transposase
MPRQLRLLVGGVATHIVQRGHNRAACFRADSDYLLYLLHLRELAKKHGCEVHAYCLMTNHVHLLITPSTDRACASLMRDLGQRYVQYFNRRYVRSGTLWESRFRSFLVESARYLLACYCYIERNPVEAGMVAQPCDYAWSSHAANSGMRADPAIQPHAEYVALAGDVATRQWVYTRMVNERMESSLKAKIEEAFESGYPLASDGFKADLATRLGVKIEPGRPGRPRKQTAEEPLGLPEIGL